MPGGRGEQAIDLVDPRRISGFRRCRARLRERAERNERDGTCDDECLQTIGHETPPRRGSRAGIFDPATPWGRQHTRTRTRGVLAHDHVETESSGRTLSVTFGCRNDTADDATSNRAAQYMKAGGFHLQNATTEPTGDGDRAAPRLFALRREWVQPGVINPLSSLFHPAVPQIGFSRAEQRVLTHALLNRTDADIAAQLGLSLDAVK